MIAKDVIFYKLCVDSFVDGICIIDQNGFIVMNNKPLEKIFGYKENELKQKRITVLIPDKYKETNINHFLKLIKNPRKLEDRFVNELYGLHKNGKIIHVEVKLKPFDYNGQLYTKLTISDISIRKYRERKIRTINYGLEKEVKKQNKELKHLVKKLESSNSQLTQEVQQKVLAEKKAKASFKKEKEYHILKSKFLSMASHEFKTPLSGIYTSATLIGKYNNTGNEKIAVHVEKIKKLVNQFNAILDDFLLLEKTESRKINYHPEKFILCDLIEEILNDAQSVVKKGQHFELNPCKEKAEVYHDKKILSLIFRNIIYNAIKYSKKNSLIRVDLTTNGYITVRIQDEGIGIPKKDQKHIFERFFRAGNALPFQGTGIGLNIVKHHVEALKGSIKFKSEENKGSVFTVKLPLKITDNHENK
jgi:PAS domain S-box-containing protein